MDKKENHSKNMMSPDSPLPPPPLTKCTGPGVQEHNSTIFPPYSQQLLSILSSDYVLW